MPPNQDHSQRQPRSITRRAEHLYEVLEVPKDASEDDIKRAYRRLALRYHPDKNQNDPEASKKFQEINYANTILSNPTKRRIYDEYGEMGIKMVDQLGEDRCQLALRPWVKWAVCTIFFLTCGCFGCCCCCLFCFNCCCGFCCGKCKPEGVRDPFEEFERQREGDPENPVQQQPAGGAVPATDSATSHITLVCEPPPHPAAYEPPPPYTPMGPNSPLATAPPSYGTTAATDRRA